jgi:hypothetical protein
MLTEWELEQRTPTATLQRQRMPNVEAEPHLLCNQARPEQQLIDKYLTQAIPIKQLHQQQLSLSLPLIGPRQYDIQSNINIKKCRACLRASSSEMNSSEVMNN